jgi:hypothetical protein
MDWSIIKKEVVYKKKKYINKVYQLLAHGWWFSPGTLASRSSTTKTGHHDIVEILLKVVLKYKKIKYIILYAVLYTEECLLPSNLI